MKSEENQNEIANRSIENTKFRKEDRLGFHAAAGNVHGFDQQRYLTLNPEAYFEQQKAVYIAHRTMLMMHILASMLAILIGPFQFLPGLRKGRLLKVHRWLGRT